MKFLNNIDLALNEVRNAKFHNLASEPTGYAGLNYYNTATFKVGVFANGTWKYFLTDDLLGAVSGIATLNASSKVVQDPASAYTLSAGAVGRIPLSSTGGRLDVSYIPLLNNIPAPTASLSMNSQLITNLADPQNPQDAATKNYVDLGIQGIERKTSALVATTANITLTNTQTVDTVALAIGDRVLVKNQSTASQNGLYVVAAGAWTRASDYNSWAEFVRSYVFITDGSVNKGVGYACTVATGGTLDTTSITYSQFTAATSINGANVGAGTGQIFRDVVGTVVNFKTLAAGSTKLGISNGADAVTLDVNEGNLVFANMTNSGTLAVGKGGTGTTSSTGSGAVVLANTPTLITPVLGVATATSINKVTFTQPATGAVLTLAEGATLATVGGYTSTLTFTAATAVTFPTSGTLLSTAAAVTVAQGGTGGNTAAIAKTNLGFVTKYATDIGNGALSIIPVTHNLNTLDVTISVYDKSTGDKVYPDVRATDANTATFTFSTAPTASQYRVIVVG